MVWGPVVRHGTMRALLLLLAVAQALAKNRPVFSEEIAEIIQFVHDNCVEKTGATEEDIKNCEDGIFKEDEKLKCYMFCLIEEANFVDDDGNVDYDMMISMIPEQWLAQVSKMILACKHHDVPGKSQCQRAFDVHKCCYEQDPELYFLF